MSTGPLVEDYIAQLAVDGVNYLMGAYGGFDPFGLKQYIEKRVYSAYGKASVSGKVKKAINSAVHRMATSSHGVWLGLVPQYA
jgi:hypothetical protein